MTIKGHGKVKLTINDTPYNKVTGSVCVSLSVPKELANC